MLLFQCSIGACVMMSDIPQYHWERGARGEGDSWDLVEREMERRQHMETGCQSYGYCSTSTNLPSRFDPASPFQKKNYDRSICFYFPVDYSTITVHQKVGKKKLVRAAVSSFCTTPENIAVPPERANISIRISKSKLEIDKKFMMPVLGLSRNAR